MKLLMLMSLLLFTFALSVGCTKVSTFDNEPIPEEQGAELSAEDQEILDTETTEIEPLQIFTKMHVPSKEVTLSPEALGSYASLIGKIKLSTLPITLSKERKTQFGTLTVVDDTKLIFKYTPNPGYRGIDVSGKLYIVSDEFSPGELNVLASVKSRDPEPKPLSVVAKNLGCIMCHAKFLGSSYIVSDFSLDTSAFLWTEGAAENDLSYHGQSKNHFKSFSSAKLDVNTKFLIPDKTVNTLAMQGCTTPGEGKLIDYVKCNFNITNTNADAFQLSNQINIGAPTVSQLTSLRASVLELVEKDIYLVPGLEGLLYFPNDVTAKVDLAGVVKHANGTFYNDPTKPLVCDGDILVTDVIRLTNLKLQTQEGCRVYSTKSIFLEGSVDYTVANALNAHLQLASARAVILGAGSIKTVANSKRSCAAGTPTSFNAQYCENANALKPSAPVKATNVLKARFGFFEQKNTFTGEKDASACKVTPQLNSAEGQALLAQWQPQANYFKMGGLSAPQVKSYLTEVMRDSDQADQVSEQGGVIKDFTCLSNASSKNAIVYKSLLINAPLVQGRYDNLYAGIVIADNIMWSMSKMQIISDPVFNRVPILPLLDLEFILKFSK
ncbi:MAG: hypothetical protein HOO06_10510 [Bdellovibrionaceae bacterium]|jgi:hypothetical protein|nr:hypothetical protein [Pseudobdellovibrionaceae bacterium]